MHMFHVFGSAIEFPSFTKYFGIWFINITEVKRCSIKYLFEIFMGFLHLIINIALQSYGLHVNSFILELDASNYVF